MIFMTGGKRIQEQIDKIHELSIKTHEATLLIGQEQHRIKEDVEKTERQVEQMVEVQSRHSNELEKLTSYSASHKKEIAALQKRQSTVEENQKSKQPIWNTLGKLWDRFIFAAGALIAAWFFGFFK